MPSCCLTPATCLSERQRVMRISGPFGWGIKCMDCIEGCARQMDRHVPEPDPHDTQSPVAVAKRVARPPDKCATCGKGITRGAKICKKCWSLSRRVNHAKCSTVGCRNKARRGGKCHTHFWASRPAPYRREKRA
jgi:hypothetical protein